MHPDDPVARLAASQAGVVGRRQVLGLGRSDDWVGARLRSGRWQRLYDGVFATFSGPVPFETRVWGAVLRAGPGAVARGWTAAALYGLVPGDPSRPVEVMLPQSRRIDPGPGIQVRYCRDLDRRRGALRNPPRLWVEDVTLDLAGDCTALEDVAGWVSRANASGLTSPDRILAALRERRRHRWRVELEAMLADVATGAHSPLELRYLNRVERAHGLPRGVRQAPSRGSTVRFVDVEVAEFATRIELDGRIGHEHEGAFRDRRRDNEGVRTGWVTLRYGVAEVLGAPCEVAAEVAAVLQTHGWPGRPRRCGPSCPVTQD